MQDANVIKVHALVNVIKLVNKSNKLEFLFCKSTIILFFLKIL